MPSYAPPEAPPPPGQPAAVPQPAEAQGTAPPAAPTSSSTAASAAEASPPLPPRPAEAHLGSAGLATVDKHAPVPSTDDDHQAFDSEQRDQQDDEDVATDEYVRDPHKLVGYLVPFPAPNLELPEGTSPPPLRFLVYTPPPPPLLKPEQGEKEGMSHKVQRKWQQEVRQARQSDAKVASWHGIKSRITKGVAWATDKTTSAQLDFLTRIPKDGTPISSPPTRSSPRTSTTSSNPSAPSDSDQKEQRFPEAHEPDPAHDDDTTAATVHLDEMVFLYPPSLDMTPEQIREEFLNTILRTRKQAEKDAIIATGLLPVTAALDWALVFVGWIFGGALEVDAVWAASSIRGAKTARSVTKRLNSSAAAGKGNLQLKFVPSWRAEPLRDYLLVQCQQRAPARFMRMIRSMPPSEQDVLGAIGWMPSEQYEEHNWEDEQWEHTQVERDLQTTMHKAARTWDHWTSTYLKNPQRALKK